MSKVHTGGSGVLIRAPYASGFGHATLALDRSASAHGNIEAPSDAALLGVEPGGGLKAVGEDLVDPLLAYRAVGLQSLDHLSGTPFRVALPDLTDAEASGREAIHRPPQPPLR